MKLSKNKKQSNLHQKNLNEFQIFLKMRKKIKTIIKEKLIIIINTNLNGLNKENENNNNNNNNKLTNEENQI